MRQALVRLKLGHPTHPPEADGLDEGAEHVAAPVLQRQPRDGAPAQRVGVGGAVALQQDVT